MVRKGRGGPAFNAPSCCRLGLAIIEHGVWRAKAATEAPRWRLPPFFGDHPVVVGGEGACVAIENRRDECAATGDAWEACRRDENQPLCEESGPADALARVDEAAARDGGKRRGPRGRAPFRAETQAALADGGRGERPLFEGRVLDR